MEAISNILHSKNRIIAAIDGMCASGKSSLASCLSDHLNCNVIHMDDYYTPMEMKTKERLAQPGGNLHYERFKEEILDHLLRNEAAIYRAFNAHTGLYKEAVRIEPKSLTIIEGSYALHPALQDSYDLKVFMSVDPAVQQQRILRRNGAEKLKRFNELWIPLEDNYFRELDIKSICDFVMDTTALW